MACMASESGAPSVGAGVANKKRCSLPGPMGSLNLYTTHQQRRLSERGLMVYRPSKPDIDLIGDFINPNKKSMSSSPASTSASQSTSTAGSPPKSTAKISPLKNLPTITSPSRSVPEEAEDKHTSMIRGVSAGPGNGNGPLSSNVMATASRSRPQGARSGTASPTSPTSSSGYRKVRIRIQKSPSGKENKFVEMQTITAGSSKRSASVSVERDPGDMILHNPLFDSRRFSDSMTCTPPVISISLTRDGSDAGIVCSTGDLRALKCLTSSAQEIRFYSCPDSRDASMSRDGENETPPPDPNGNRSRSFDATSTVVTSRRKGIGTSWFSRRHLPIAAKLPMPLKSPSVPNSPGPHQLTLKAPILTVTNETSGQSELIEVPSPPASTPTSGDAGDGKTKVIWDQSGFQIDAAVLGSVIENHLRKTEMRRRATVSTLYEPNFGESHPSSARARSASACVIPNFGAIEGSDPIFTPRSEHCRPAVTFLSANSVGTPPTPRRSSMKTPGATNSTCRNSSLGGRLSFQAPCSAGETEVSYARKQKRFSLSGPSSYGQGYSPMVPTSSSREHWPFQTQSTPDTLRKHSHGHTFVETVDSSGKVKTTTKSSYSTPYTYVLPPINGRINTEDEEEEESRRRAAYYKKTSAQGQGTTGLSICTAIRDFIIHSLKS